MQVPLQKTTALELLPKPKDPPADGSGSSSSSTASTKAGTFAKLVVPESVYAPIPAEREAELRKKWFEKELVSDVACGSSGGVPVIQAFGEAAAAPPLPSNPVLESLTPSCFRVLKRRDSSTIVLFGRCLPELSVFFAARRRRDCC